MQQTDFSYTQWKVLANLNRYHGLKTFLNLHARLSEIVPGCYSEATIRTSITNDLIPIDYEHHFADAFRLSEATFLRLLKASTCADGLGNEKVNTEKFRNSLEEEYKHSLAIFIWQLDKLIECGSAVHNIKDKEELNNKLAGRLLKDKKKSLKPAAISWPDKNLFSSLALNLKFDDQSLADILWEVNEDTFTEKSIKHYKKLDSPGDLSGVLETEGSGGSPEGEAQNPPGQDSSEGKNLSEKEPETPVQSEGTREPPNAPESETKFYVTIAALVLVAITGLGIYHFYPHDMLKQPVETPNMPKQSVETSNAPNILVEPKNAQIVLNKSSIQLLWKDAAAPKNQETTYVLESISHQLDSNTWERTETKLSANELKKEGDLFSYNILNPSLGENLWTMYREGDKQSNQPLYAWRFLYFSNQLERIKYTGKLEVATVPSCNPDDEGQKNCDGRFKEFEIDLIEFIAKRLGKEFGATITPVYKETRWNSISPDIEEGKAQIAMSSITNLKDRNTNAVDFTDGYFFPEQVIIQRKDDDETNFGKNLVELLKGKKVGVIDNSSNLKLAETLNQNDICNACFTIVKNSYYQSLKEDLMHGEIQYILIDREEFASGTLSCEGLEVVKTVSDEEKKAYLEQYVNGGKEAYVFIVKEDSDQGLKNKISDIISSEDGKNKLEKLKTQFLENGSGCVSSRKF